ncbi:EAL domain-containing protein [Anaerobacillus alkaliphilus]|uniref:EAL domain-containing protein n=1 Tax=Anaerobacillus alkaliphilus TaxID=1548597 RepID=A0A4Q0VVA7_9BACI|nr:EAL domain-containing protein [Anaerobacillus alkaliphilus]RXJ02790.1 EAL domain-containing protein [Anaerobacillus alkaliphilus]
MSYNQMNYSPLSRLSKLLTDNIELKEVLEQVVMAISDEVKICHAVGIILRHQDGTFQNFIEKTAEKKLVGLGTLVEQLVNDSLLDTIVDTNESLLSKDSEILKRYKLKSLLITPITYSQELYGCIYLADYEADLTSREEAIIKKYAQTAAIVVSNADNLTHKEHLLYEKQLLLDVTRDFAHLATMQEVLDKCFHYVSQVLNNVNIGALILDPIAEKKIKPTRLSKASKMTEVEWKEKHSELKIDHNKDPLYQEVLQTKKAIFIPDVFADERPNHDACRAFGIKSLFRIPLVAMGSVLGVISVVNLDEANSYYTTAQMRLAQSIVDATALALSNLLFREKQEIIIEERTAEISLKNKELEKVIKELQRLSREKELILHSAGEGIFGLGIEGEITFCNPAAARMLGYEDKGDLIGKKYHSIFNRIKTNKTNYLVEFANYIDNHLSNYGSNEEFFRKDGSRFPVEYAVSPIKEDDKLSGYVVIFKDITVRKQMEEKIKFQAYYDSLTSLPNRVLLKDRLSQAITNANLHQEKLAVLFIDLDRFKLVNDTLGHSYGDHLLQKVAVALAKCVPEGATVSRQGGDEFTIILPTILENEQVNAVTSKIINAFSQPFDLKGNEVFIKPSIGISVFPEDGEDVDTLIKNADTAMYKSKELQGNNFQFYNASMEKSNLRSAKVENGLHKALENNEFVLHYQPQINSRTNKLIGVEALLRWNHPTMGVVSPADFIPVAEETGLIVPIGEWVLRNACKQVKSWHDLGLGPIVVSVNLSARQFEKQDLIELVKDVLAETKLDPSFLELELTENLIIKNTDATLETMVKLRELGIKISIDDFGTGYSSLGYLKNFPINTLKIDRSFVSDVVGDLANAAITNTIITLADNLSLNVIAEGVETEDQMKFLSSKGCFLMQGFMFSPPIKAEDFMEKYFEQDDQELLLN